MAALFHKFSGGLRKTKVVALLYAAAGCTINKHCFDNMSQQKSMTWDLCMHLHIFILINSILETICNCWFTEEFSSCNCRDTKSLSAGHTVQ